MLPTNRVRLWVSVVLAASAVQAAAVSSIACHPQAPKAPTLGEVVSRVDVPRLLECAAMRGSERARCLGASLATSALDLAVDKAAELAEQAKDAIADKGGAGASDVTPAERVNLASDLDAALADVAREVALANAGG